MHTKFKPVVTGGLAKQIANNIGEAILQGRLKIDERLPSEHELAAQFGVSRPTVREALKRLAAQNLVRSQRGPAGGTFVAKPTDAELQATLSNATTMLMSLGGVGFPDLAEAREHLERICCRLAAERRTDAHLEALENEIRIQADPKSDDIAFCSSDLRFHKTLVAATGNPLMRLVMVSVIDSLQSVTNLVTYPARARQKIVGQHEAILRAVRESDPDAAEAAIEQQMKYVAETYVDAQELRRKRKAARPSHSA